ncbi:MAG TPA: SDR family NAD(P)-dependent oxidoreductase, partial [Micromonosporaceae bacterium]|nr:SDR family NAD(P)-dependent oxidoreductase [Micromonosporaceae bacterium]
MSFVDRYGTWAVIAGASEGIGAAFARTLAARGLDLVLVARRPGPLAALASSLPVRTVVVSADLATPDGLDDVARATAGLDVGLVVANAAYSPIGPFAGLDPAQTARALDLNCRAPLWLAHRFLPPMAARRRGGFIVMSSLAGQQGSPGIAAYAATKAFGAVLAEGLWAELRGSGVHVLGCVAGAVSTPNLAAAKS